MIWVQTEEQDLKSGPGQNPALCDFQSGRQSPTYPHFTGLDIQKLARAGESHGMPPVLPSREIPHRLKL
jgi:hypothetical protein